MKSLLKTLFVVISVSVASVANANDQLVASIRKVFASDTSTIKYDMISVAAFGSNAYKGGAKQAQHTGYLLKDGDRELYVSEFKNNGKLHLTACALHIDGFTYSFGTGFDKPDKPIFDAERWTNLTSEAFKVADAENTMGSAYNVVMSGFKYHFLPLLPAENEILLNEGEVMMNPCTEYSTSGSQVIDGKNLQFIEYKTPVTYPIDMTTRYYFDNERLVKCVNITKKGEVPVSPEIQAAYGGTLETRVGGYTIINIYEFTTDVDTTFLTLPKGIKIVKNPFKQ